MTNFTLFGGKVKATQSFLNVFKSNASLGVVLLFLLSVNNIQAQVVPCIDGNSFEWGSPQLQSEATFELRHDVFTGNMDDIYTGSKDYKLFGPNNNDSAYNEWTLSPMQAKSDIMNAAAVLFTGVSSPPGCTSTFGAYDPTHTYLFFAGDRESNLGSGYIGFWFLLNGTTATTDNGQNIFDPAHSIGDLLILANFESGGREAVVTVLKWVGPGIGTHGNNLSLALQGTDAQVGQNNDTQTPVPASFIVPEGQTVYDYNEFYEGVIDLTEVFNLQDPNNSSLLCSATWLLETRASKEITADLKDFVGGNFNITPTIQVTDDTICEGETGSIKVNIFKDVDEENPIVDPIAKGFTIEWTGPNGFIASGTDTITPTVEGTYTATVGSGDFCDETAQDTGTLSFYPGTDNIEDSATVCVGDSYTWSQNGETYTAADSPVVLDFEDSDGCPYTATLTIDEYPVTDDTYDESTVCVGDTYNWSVTGLDYGLGSYSVGQTDGNGCDYTAYLDVYNHPVTDDTYDESTVCVGDTYNWSVTGLDYGLGSYSVGQTDGNGCDYTAYLDVYNHPVTDDTYDESTVCVGDTYNWSVTGLDYGLGSYSVGQTDGNGCDYTAYLDVYNHPVTDDSYDESTVCVGDTYNWSVTGLDYGLGSYSVGQTDGNGCDYTAYLDVYNHPVTDDTYDESTVCVGDTYNWSVTGLDYGLGSYSVGQTDGNGCDYTAYLDVYNHPVTDDTYDEATVCTGDTYNWSVTGLDYGLGSYSVGQTDGNGCDYTAYLDVYNHPVTDDTYDESTVCVGDTYNWSVTGLDYGLGSYSVGQTDGNGCDYTAYLDVYNHPVTDDTYDEATVCTGDTYNWSVTGLDYGLGSYSVGQTDGNGCDYTAYLDVYNHPVTDDTYDESTVCEGDTYNWSVTGLDYGLGSYSVGQTDGNGCDYTAYLDVYEYPTPTCIASVINNDQCEGIPISLSVAGADGTAPYTYKWTGASVGLLDDDTSATPVLTGAGVGAHNFTVTVTDANGCTNTCNVTATVVDCIVDCGTAFGVAITEEGAVDDNISRCFRNDGFSRWGWSNYYEFTEDTSVELELYQGAGKCDLNKGTFVGIVTIDYTHSDGNLEVTYDMAPGYGLDEVHLYVGCERYPQKNGTNTVAPGQFTFTNGNLQHADMWTTDFADITVSGGFFIIAHSVACGEAIPEGSFIPTSPMEHGSFDGDADADCEVTVDGWGKAEFTAYPVPFDKEVNIKYVFDYKTNVTIEVYDIKGTLLHRSVNANYVEGTVDKATLDLSKFANQMFFVKMTTSEGTVTKKIVSSSLKR